MQYISQQDLYNTARGKKLYAIPYDLRPRKDFEACHVMRAWNLDILSLDTDLNKIKASKEESIEFLNQVPGFDKVQKRFDVNVYLISDKQTEVFLEDISAIFGNSISPSRIFALDVEFDTFHSNYPIMCSKMPEEKMKRKILYKFPNEIIPNLFLGGYSQADIMIDILQELGITHILNCALEFNQGSDGKPFVDYKVPDGVIIHHLNMIDEPGQPMNFEDSFKFIDDALNGTKTTQLHSSCSALNHQSKIFVHCYMGVSRSASVVIEYLMEKYHLTLNQAYKIVYHQRSVIFPNFGFMKQLYLKEYELVDQIGVEDQQLQKLPKNDNNQYMAIEIDLRKRIQPLIGIQEISKLPELNNGEMTAIFNMYIFSYNQANEEWNRINSLNDTKVNDCS